MKLFPLVGLVALVSACTHSDETVTVTNPSDFDRSELISIDRPDYSFCIVDAAGAEIPYQITSDGKVLFETEIAAKSTAVFRLKAGQPAVFPDTVAVGRLHPERLDDFAWENDRAAYRAYGPALQKKGERAFGYDVWTKKVTYPVAEKRYYNNVVLKIPYHEDLGDGMDAYTVGASLGGGTTALLDGNGEIIYPWAFEKAEVLDNGPLSIRFRLTYPPFVSDGDTIVEIRTITLDKCSDFNQTQVEYKGLRNKRKAVAGIVVHKQNADGYKFYPEIKGMAYADLTDAPDAGHGVIYLGIIAPDAERMLYKALPEPDGDAVGHILAEHEINPGDTLTYFWGSGWSGGFVKDQSDWDNIMARKYSAIKQPLEITFK